MLIQIMSLCLCVVVILFIKPLLSQTDICIWGRTVYNEVINGLYVSQGATYMNNSVYVSTGPGCNTMYMFWDTLTTSSPQNGLTAWMIDDTVGDTSPYAYCIQSINIKNCNTWYVYDSVSYVLDASTYTLLNSCPSWNCDTISIPTLTNGCGLTYDIALGNNIWRNSAGTHWWYFNHKDFKYECVKLQPNDYCGNSYYADTDQGWIDLSKGQSVQLDFDYPANVLHTVHCIGDPTRSPTKNPTQIPTFNPTQIPTNNQTHNPTHIANTQISVAHTPAQTLTVLYVFLVLILVCVFVMIIVCVYRQKKKQSESVKNTQNVVYGVKNTQEIVSNVNDQQQKVDTDNVYIDNKQDEEVKKRNDENGNVHVQMDKTEVKILENESKVNKIIVGELIVDKNVKKQNEKADVIVPPGSQKENYHDLGGSIDGVYNMQLEGNIETVENEVEKWLVNTVKLPRYCDVFVDNGYDSLDIIKAISSKNELEDIGITLKGHIVKIMKEIKKLNDDTAY
eukprot:258606_1